MIAKYLEFINENWQQEYKEIVNSIFKKNIDVDEIEDCFMSLIDDGFSFTSEKKYGYFDGFFQGVGRKEDLSTKMCFPFISIRLQRSFESFSSDFNLTKSYLKRYEGFINDVEIACKRISNKNIEIVNRRVYIENSSIKFEILLKINQRLPPFQDQVYISPIDRIKNKIINNKLLSITDTGKDKFRFKVNRDILKSKDIMPDREQVTKQLDDIVKSIFNRDKLMNMGIETTLSKIGEDEYEIKVL